MSTQPDTFRLTGRHVMGGFVGAFGVIIAVNLVMAWFAVSTFPGVEVQNSYVASQGFNTRLAEQRALGWQTRVEVAGDELRLFVNDPDGFADVAQLTATLGRATHTRSDVTPEFRRIPGGFAAPVTLEPGNWNLRLVALAADGTEFRQRISFWHRPAAPAQIGGQDG
jgi:nitrogen fixation protein FixH